MKKRKELIYSSLFLRSVKLTTKRKENFVTDNVENDSQNRNCLFLNMDTQRYVIVQL